LVVTGYVIERKIAI